MQRNLLLCIILIFNLLFVYSKPVEYQIETLTSTTLPKYSLGYWQAIQSPSKSELIYFLPNFELVVFNQNDGKLSQLINCLYSECYSSYDQFLLEESLPANRTKLLWRTFQLDETNETVHLSSGGHIYLFNMKSGMIKLLSGLNNTKPAAEGIPLKEASFREIVSITKDSIGNLYICDNFVIFKVDSNGIVHEQISFINSESNQYTRPDFITIRNNFIYGYDTTSLFEINMETNKFRTLYPNLSSFLGISILSDDSILFYNDLYFKTINPKNGEVNILFDFDKFVSSGFGIKVFAPNLMINGNQIQKIDFLKKKTIPIFDGYFGAVQDGMLLSNRQFKSVVAMAFNESIGDLFIADSSSIEVLQKVDSLDRVESVTASFSDISCWNSSIRTASVIAYNPVSLQIKDSNLYLANTGIQSSIQKFDLSKKNYGCFYAGSISSDRLLNRADPLSIVLNNPNGIHFSKGTNELFIADTDNHRILRNGTMGVEVIAGNGVQGFSGDGELAVLAKLDKPHSIYYEDSTNILYIADSGNHRIRIIQMNTGIISTIIGNGIPGFNGDELNPLETQLNFPKFVLKTKFGLLISDTNNNRLRSFNGTSVTTILGSGYPGSKIDANNPQVTELNSPFGLYYSVGSPNILVADSFNHRILFFILDLKIVSILAGTNSPGFNGDGMNPTQAKLFLPTSVWITNDDKILVADSYNNRVRMISLGIIYTVKDSSQQQTAINIPIGLCMNSLGEILVSSGNGILSIGNEIKKVIGGLGDGMHVFNAHVNPTRMIFDPNNRMVISESNSNRIRLVDESGRISTIVGNGYFGYGDESKEATSVMLASPTGLSFSPDFNTLYFADSSNNRIRKLVSNKVFLVAGTGGSGISSSTDPLKFQFNNPRLITTLTNGDVVIGDNFNNQILIISNTDGTIRKIGNVISPTDMISTRNNTLYISTSDMILKAIPKCENGYQLVRNNTECVPICHGKVENDACSRRGECESPNSCTCWKGLFTGDRCEIPICFGIAANDTSVCSFSNGTCGLNNLCQCREGFTGDRCEIPICFSQIIGQACGGTLRGSCINKDKCLCNEDFTGERCELRMCSGRSENDTTVCNGHGKCVENGRCECAVLYSGLDCSDLTQIYALSISGSIIVLILIVLVLVSVILGLTVYRKNRKERKMLETDLSLDERLLSTIDDNEMVSFSTSSTNTTRTIEDPSSFIIPLHKIGMDKPIKRLGTGGMGSVFMTKFNGMTVAVKVFDLNNLNISEEDFKNEAIVLSKLRHPNIINFYGISTSPTKRYIVMECLDQSLENVIAKMEMKNVSYSLDQKLRMMLNIANGIEYLHTLKPRRIIHRDLKTANILLDSNGNCKVCDFGLSKSISQATVSALTNQLGTHYYMSPELFDIKPIDPSYATSVDIYSFSIIMWQILFEIKDPYLSKSPDTLKKLGMTSTDPHEQITSYQLTKMICEKNHRPVIPFTSINSCRDWCSQYLPSNTLDQQAVFSICELIQQCWQTDPKLRPSIEQVIQQLETILSKNQ